MFLNASRPTNPVERELSTAYLFGEVRETVDPFAPRVVDFSTY